MKYKISLNYQRIFGIQESSTLKFSSEYIQLLIIQVITQYNKNPKSYLSRQNYHLTPYQLMKKRCITVGITGPTTAGKTTISQLISDNYNCKVLHEDKYFNYSRVYDKLGGNCQVPEAIDREMFAKDVEEQINSGKHEILVVEGFQLFYSEHILRLLDVKIFLDIDDQTIHYRRMKVNPCSEEYFKESILKQFHIYKKVAEKVPDVKFVDSRKKIVEVYRDTAKYITEAQNKK